MAKEPLSRTPGSVVCNFGDMPTPAFRGAGEPHVGRAPSPANIIRRCADNEGSDIGKTMNAPRRFAISNPLPSTLSFRMSGFGMTKWTGADLFRNLGLKRVTGKIRETKEL